MSYLNYLIDNFKTKGILIDANLLLLLIIGTVDTKLINTFKKTLQYSELDYQKLVSFLSWFQIFTTPNILTEVSNHCETINKQYNGLIYHQLKDSLNVIQEQYLISVEVTKNNIFIKLGLTDGAIYELAKIGLLVLRDDLDLFSYLYTNGCTAINFNHIRSEYLLKPSR